jgi:high-affinity nickel permease
MLGMRHATDPDHIVAVTTIVSLGDLGVMPFEFGPMPTPS